MKMIGILVAAMVAFTCSCAFGQGLRPRPWQQEPTSFLGIKLDAPLDTSIPPCPNTDGYGPTRYGWIAFKKPCFQPVSTFFEVRNIPGFWVMYVRLIDGNVGFITTSFPSEATERTMAALIEKFGEPRERVVEDVMSRAGVPYKNHKADWMGPNITLVCESVGEKVDEGDLTITTTAYLKRFNMDEKEQTERLKNQF